MTPVSGDPWHLQMLMKVDVKRAYDPPSRNDGKRFLVDRLWPRGMKKENLRIEAWLRDLAPSDELRKWYHERPAQWLAFRKRYLEELAAPEAMAALEQLLPGPGQRQDRHAGLLSEERGAQ